MPYNERLPPPQPTGIKNEQLKIVFLTMEQYKECYTQFPEQNNGCVNIGIAF